jgi:Ca2+:H+ antiporter
MKVLTHLSQAYLIGLWFSLRTHASQIWQNPQPLMKLDEVPAGGMHPAHRATVYQRLTPQAVMQQLLPTTAKPQDPVPASAPASNRRATTTWDDQQLKPAPRPSRQPSRTGHVGDPTQATQRRNASLISTSRTPVSQTPRMPTNASQDKLNEVSELHLPKTIAGEAFNTEEFTRAVAVATVNALKSHENAIAREWKQARVPAALVEGAAVPIAAAAEEEQGGHEGPSWSRTVSSCVLLGCTVLYAIIAGESRFGWTDMFH